MRKEELYIDLRDGLIIGLLIIFIIVGNVFKSNNPINLLANYIIGLFKNS